MVVLFDKVVTEYLSSARPAPKRAVGDSSGYGSASI
jgi:hypothetical protein